MNSLCVRWKSTFERFERLNNGIQTLVEINENDNEKLAKRRQLTKIDVENKIKNKTLPPHKTNSLLFRPSNEFIEGLFKVNNFLS